MEFRIIYKLPWIAANNIIKRRGSGSTAIYYSRRLLVVYASLHY